MKLDFPVDSTMVEVISDELDRPKFPLFSLRFLEVEEKDFFLDVYNVANFRVTNGEKIQIRPYDGKCDPESISLFLNGSILGVVLHQRGILPLHGSSFDYLDKGIMICGRSGVGKSSVAMAFCQNGAKFITDDISPVKVSEHETFIIPIRSRVKLWDDTLRKLNIENNDLSRIRPGFDKFYLPAISESKYAMQRLHQLFVLSIHNKNEFIAEEQKGMDKYNVLLRQIYRKAYLKGMPETEKAYFKQLFKLASAVRIKIIKRPQICSIQDTMRFIENEISK